MIFETLLIGMVTGAAAAVAMVFFLRRRWGAGRDAVKPRIEVRGSVERIRAVGELVVLKAYTQQIVTQSDHMLGQWGEKWMRWLISSKKTALIFEFVVDFRFNLHSPQLKVEPFGEDGLRLLLPPCHYEIQLKDIQFYDERNAALVPLLLPDWIGQVFGGRFTEYEKNQLVQAAREKAEGLARELTGRMMGEVRSSAENTLRSITRSMGFETIECAFSEDQPTQGKVDVSQLERDASSAVARQG